ncbi:hypothetical protein Tco_1428448 [Tanacetum coccineum]
MRIKIYDGNACWNRIGVDTARHILILLGKVNMAGLKVSIVRLKLVLVGSGPFSKKTAWEHDVVVYRISCVATARCYGLSASATQISRCSDLLSLRALGEGSTIPVESHYTPISAPSTSQPQTSSPSIQTTHVAEEAATMPHDSPLPRVHSLGSDEGSMTLNELMLIMKVKKLEHKVKSSKSRRKVRLVVSEDEDELEDPSKQGRKIAQIDEDEGITLVQMSAQTQGRHEHDLESDFEFTTPEEDYIAEPDISTANVPVSTAGAKVSTASPEVKTAAESLVYIKEV